MHGGDSDALAITPMMIGETYYYEYDVADAVDVVAYLTNSVGENRTITLSIELSWPITDMHLLVSFDFYILNLFDKLRYLVFVTSMPAYFRLHV